MISYLSATMLALIGVTRLMTVRAGPRHLATFFLSMAAGLAVSADATVRLLGDDLLPRLVTNALQLLAMRALVQVVRSTRSPEKPTPFWPIVLCWALMFLCYLDIVPHRLEVGTPAFQWRWSVVAYQVVLTAYGVTCLVLFTRMLARSAASRPQGTFRTGLRILVCAAVTTIAWVLFSGLPSLWLEITDLADLDFLPRARLVGLGAMVLWVLGGLFTTWDGALRLARAWRGIRAVTPLWKELVAAHPQIALPVRHDLEFTLYRRVIEIRDGLLALRAHVPPQLGDWLRTPVDEPTRAAAELAAALVMRAAGRSWPHPPAGPEDAHPGVREESAWLSAVSSAFTNSRVVREVRERALAEAGHLS
ncbi:MAB_1171c family putative transporter [Amycolatopsis coloradensis]|uniref:MAB_1171c family putative transporter n=1 Tax=Amycolatopsis coloradensis TaxID=76021 RepID=A0ACD5B3V3_9PSEU